MNGGSLLAQALPGLTVMAAVLLALRWWSRRARPSSGSRLRVVERVALSRNATLAVVEAAGRRFLVGGGERITLLAELTPAPAHVEDEDEPMALPGRERPTIGPRTGLLDQLRAMTVRTPGLRPHRAARRPLP